MSLFLASIGLALVLRQALLLAYGPQPQQYRVDPYKVHVLGSVRLSQAQFITILAAAAIIVAIGLFLSRTTLGRTMRALADDRALAAIAGLDVGRIIALTWILSGMLAAIAGILAGLAQTTFDPNFGVPAPPPDLRRGRSRWHRQRLRRARRRPDARRRDGALDLALLLRRRRPGLQARRRLRRARRRADGEAAGALRPAHGSYERTCERRVLGLRRRRRRHLHDLRARAPAAVRAHRPPQLRPRRLHGDRRVRDGDPRREGAIEHVGRGAARDPRRCRRGPAARLAVAEATRRLLRDRHDRLQRDRPLRRARIRTR